MAKSAAPDENASGSPLPDATYAPLEEVIARVIGELTEVRIRNRALLACLMEGEFSWDRYTEEIVTIRIRDFNALFSSLVLNQSKFEDDFAEWLKEDHKRYQILSKASKGESRPSQEKPSSTKRKRLPPPLK